MRTQSLRSLGVAAVLALTACTRSAGSGASHDTASTTVVPSERAAADSLPATSGVVATVSPIGMRGPTRATDIHGDRPSQGPGVADTAGGGAQATVARLEREARAIARTDGCRSASDCRTAPVGVKSCGGPRTYIVYCTASTDTVALMRKLRELERAEKAYNEKSGMMSTCEMRLAPTTALVGRVCREKPAGP